MTKETDMESREEKCRRLAEWLGFRYGKGACYGQSGQGFGWHVADCICPDRADMVSCECVSCLQCESVAEQECCHECRLDLPDFYTSEEACALLLEKLLAIQEVSIHMMWRKALFQLTLFLPHRPTPSGLDGGIDFNSSDRKTAICKAALALIEKEAR